MSDVVDWEQGFNQRSLKIELLLRDYRIIKQEDLSFHCIIDIQQITMTGVSGCADQSLALPVLYRRSTH